MSDYNIPARERWTNQYSYSFKLEVIESIEKRLGELISDSEAGRKIKRLSY